MLCSVCWSCTSDCGETQGSQGPIQLACRPALIGCNTLAHGLGPPSARAGGVRQWWHECDQGQESWLGRISVHNISSVLLQSIDPAGKHYSTPNPYGVQDSCLTLHFKVACQSTEQHQRLIKHVRPNVRSLCLDVGADCGSARASSCTVWNHRRR
jgi:hypothetical protein